MGGYISETYKSLFSYIKKEYPLIQSEKFEAKRYIENLKEGNNLSITNIAYNINQVKNQKSNTTFFNYDLLSEIERGSTCSVMEIKNKYINIYRVLKRVFLNEKDKYYQRTYDDTIKEISILKYIDHPNIVKILGYDIYDITTKKKHIDIIEEVIRGGNLFEKLNKKKKFTEKETAFILYQISSLIKAFHNNGILNRDIKPENILFIYEDKLLIKLIDFGSSEILNSENTNSNQRVGTPSYVAPEVLKGENYNYSCDTWSIGIIMFLMLFGFLPFSGQNAKEIFNNICLQYIDIWDLNKKNNLNLKEETLLLLNSLLQKSVEKRININQILSSDFITKNINYKTKEEFLSLDKTYIKENIIKNIKTNLNYIAKYGWNKLQIISMFFFVYNLNDFNYGFNSKEYYNILSLFLYYDNDNDGYLSESEFLYINEIENIDITNSKCFFECFNINENNYISIGVFIMLCLINKNKYYKHENNIKILFDIFDHENKGYITINDLNNFNYINFIKDQSNKIGEIIYDDLNLKKEDKISYDDFKKFLEFKEDI